MHKVPVDGWREAALVIMPMMNGADKAHYKQETVRY